MPSASPKALRRRGKPAPVIEVSGRLYPIEMRWRPAERDESRPAGAPGRVGGPSRVDALVDAVDEGQRCGPGDVLVFLPGEREIREAAEALRKHHTARHRDAAAVRAPVGAGAARVFALARAAAWCSPPTSPRPR
jgi:ATP-dependent helicase HrpA